MSTGVALFQQYRLVDGEPYERYSARLDAAAAQHSQELFARVNETVQAALAHERATPSTCGLTECKGRQMCEKCERATHAAAAR